MLPKSCSKNYLPSVKLVLTNIFLVLFRGLQKVPHMQEHKHFKIRGQERIKTQAKAVKELSQLHWNLFVPLLGGDIRNLFSATY